MSDLFIQLTFRRTLLAFTAIWMEKMLPKSDFALPTKDTWMKCFMPSIKELNSTRIQYRTQKEKKEREKVKSTHLASH
jgi:hypothetical protein